MCVCVCVCVCVCMFYISKYIEYLIWFLYCYSLKEYHDQSFSTNNDIKDINSKSKQSSFKLFHIIYCINTITRTGNFSSFNCDVVKFCFSTHIFCGFFECLVGKILSLCVKTYEWLIISL